MTERRLASKRSAAKVRSVGRSWTTEQAISLAAYGTALRTAQGVASSRKWTVLGRDENFVWGLAQGSGAQPYQVQIELSEPAFKCSCPSRKFPCKHGLGLPLLFADQPGTIPAAAKPDWVVEWAAKRGQKVAKQEAKAAAPAARQSDARNGKPLSRKAWPFMMADYTISRARNSPRRHPRATGTGMRRRDGSSMRRRQGSPVACVASATPWGALPRALLAKNPLADSPAGPITIKFSQGFPRTVCMFFLPKETSST